MPRPTNKPDLIKAASEQFAKMWQLIDCMSEHEQNSPFAFGEELKKKESHWARDKNLRDVLIHLYEWHQLLLKWVKANQKEPIKPFLPAPYNWKTYPLMNVKFWEQHQTTSYGKAKNLLLESHKQVMALLDTFSDQQLFAKKHFTWTGTTNLGSYFISATSSHYDWAIKKLKAHLKNLKKS